MKSIKLKRKVSKEEEDKFLKKFASNQDYSTKIDESMRITREDGTVLAVLIRGEVDFKKEAVPFYKAIGNRIQLTDNRGTSSGSEHKTTVLKSGIVSKQLRADNVRSSIIGYYDRYPRINFCRKTAFTEKNPKLFSQCLPMIQKVDALFKKYLPFRYNIQKEVADNTSRDFIIDGTTFTTVTLNKNFRTAYHRDAGDLPEGFGCLSYIQSGTFSGGELVFPAYDAAIKLRTGDVLLFDPHEIHGNTELKAFGEFERITAIYYYRKNMIYCGSADQETERAKEGKGNGPTLQNLNPKNGMIT